MLSTDGESGSGSLFVGSLGMFNRLSQMIGLGTPPSSAPKTPHVHLHFSSWTTFGQRPKGWKWSFRCLTAIFKSLEDCGMDKTSWIPVWQGHIHFTHQCWSSGSMLATRHFNMFHLQVWSPQQAPYTSFSGDCQRVVPKMLGKSSPKAV